VERKNLQIFNDVAAAVNGYERYTIFDDVSVGVNNGIVTLTGKVTMPLKREELAKRVAKVTGSSEYWTSYLSCRSRRPMIGCVTRSLDRFIATRISRPMSTSSRGPSTSSLKMAMSP
jgi:osmotically-inducible protein OsmY